MKTETLEQEEKSSTEDLRLSNLWFSELQRSDSGPGPRGSSTKTIQNEMSLDVEMEVTYTILSKEKKSYSFTKTQLSISTLLNNCVSNQTFDNSNELEITVKINSKMMDIINEYLIHHNGTDIKTIDKPISSLNMAEVKFEDNTTIDTWDVDFINNLSTPCPGAGLKTLLELIEAANYMDMKGLLDLCCAKLATIIKGEKIDDIEKLFEGVKN